MPQESRQKFPRTFRVRVNAVFRGRHGGWKKMGEENLTKDNPPQKKTGFGPPFGWYVFHPLRCRCSVFLHRNPILNTPEALLEGSKHFSGGCVIWYAFLPSEILHPPHLMASSVFFWLFWILAVGFFGAV